MESTLKKGVISGLSWGLISVFVSRFFSLGHWNPLWMIFCGCLTGVLLVLLLRWAKGGLSRRARILFCVPVVFLGQAFWAFVLTLPITREGNWPERWIELVLGIYYSDIASLLLLGFAPLAYFNLTWVTQAKLRSDSS
jgi:ABC-type Fe3+-siderophore transport system permease subunit